MNGGGSYVYPIEDGPEFDTEFRFKPNDHAEYIDFTLPFIGTIATDCFTILYRSHNANGYLVYQCKGIVEWNSDVWI